MFVVVPGREILAIVLIIVEATLEPADAGLVGYDCGDGIQTVTPISLLDIDECNIEEEHVQSTESDIAVLILNEYKQTDIIQCKVEIRRIISHCGMSSHNSIVKDGLSEYMYPMTRKQCETAHKEHFVKIGKFKVDGLSVNNVTTKSIKFAGTIENNGYCDGVYYSDLFGSWDNVIVTGTVKVTLTKESVTTKVGSNKIILPSDTECKLSEGNCIDYAGGYTYWDALPKTDCDINTYSILYSGKANRLVSKKEIIYSVDVGDTRFALDIVGEMTSCDKRVLKTGHPKLFIMEYEDYESLYAEGVADISHDPSEIFRYTDVKFMYVERLIKNQITLLYRNIMKNRCKLEKKILQNTLSIAATRPDQLAYRYMKNPGYMAVVAGEVLYIAQCLPVIVKIRPVEKCYNELPITWGNQSLFLTPLTHVITNYATEVPCNTPFKQYYKVEKQWLKLMPTPTVVKTPKVLKMDTKINWTSEWDNDLTNLTKSGIHTMEELAGMSEQISFLMEHNVVEQIVSKQVTHNMGGSASVKNFFNDHMLDVIAEGTWSKTWGKFIYFGDNCAGILGIFMFVSAIITIIDMCIHGRALHSSYGCSIYIFGALWDTLARILLFKSNNKKIRFRSIVPYNKEFSNCIEELKFTKTNGKNQTTNKSEIPEQANLKTKISSDDRPLEIPMPAQRSDKPIAKCVNELKLTQTDNKTKTTTKPEIPKKPDLKTKIFSNSRPCGIPKPPQRPPKPIAKYIDEFDLTQADNKTKTTTKPEIPKKPVLKTEISSNNRPCEIPEPPQRPPKPIAKCIDELDLTQTDDETKTPNKPMIPKKPDPKTKIVSTNCPCEMPTPAERPRNPFSMVISELERRNMKT